MPDDPNSEREEDAIESDAALERALFDEVTAQDRVDVLSFEQSMQNLVDQLPLKGERDDVAYAQHEAATLRNVVVQLARLAKGPDTARTDSQLAILDDASMNLQSDLRELFDFDIDDAGQKGDLFYTAIGLIQAAFDIGRNTKPSDEPHPDNLDIPLPTFAAQAEQDATLEEARGLAIEAGPAEPPVENNPHPRRHRQLGVQRHVQQALIRLYVDGDPVLNGDSRSRVRRAVANHLDLPEGAVSLATLDRARLIVWPT